MIKYNFHWAKPPKAQIRYGDVWTAIRALSRIHDGIKGQSIPAVVMQFYMAMKAGDPHRPRMLREVVLAMADACRTGAPGRRDLRDIAMRRLARSVASMPVDRLEQWLRDHPRRAAFMPAANTARADRLRVAWLEEGREMITDVLDYAQAMT